MNTHDKIELPAEFRSGNDIPVTQATIKRERMEEIIRAAIAAYQQGGNAKQRYDEIMKDDAEEPDPIEDLRFFCSIAMRQQDWLDVEPFFDALIADRKRRGEPVKLDRYDAGYLGGQDGMPAYVWHDIIRSELDRAYDFYMDQIDRAAPQPAEPDTATIADYEEVLADHRRLVRELDVLLNGEEGAAEQASLCDIVAQVRREGIKTAEPVTLECPKCGVDRAKAPCAGNLMDCEFKGVAHAAEPVKVPSDEEIDALWDLHEDSREFARALLARYGQPAQPSDDVIQSLDEFTLKYLPKTHEEQKRLQERFNEWVKFDDDIARLGIAAQPSVPEPLKYGGNWKDHYVTGWNNCRAAMLAAEQAQQECGCCGRSDGCDPDCDASQPAANDDPTPEEEEAWQQMEKTNE